MTSTPGASRRMARASSGAMGRLNWTLTASEWPTKTGTRTQVTVTWMSGSSILCVSSDIFFSSSVEPSSRKAPMKGMTLKAICLGNFLGVASPRP